MKYQIKIVVFAGLISLFLTACVGEYTIPKFEIERFKNISNKIEPIDEMVVVFSTEISPKIKMKIFDDFGKNNLKQRFVEIAKDFGIKKMNFIFKDDMSEKVGKKGETIIFISISDVIGYENGKTIIKYAMKIYQNDLMAENIRNKLVWENKLVSTGISPADYSFNNIEDKNNIWNEFNTQMVQKIFNILKMETFIRKEYSGT